MTAASVAVPVVVIESAAVPSIAPGGAIEESVAVADNETLLVPPRPPEAPEVGTAHEGKPIM